ncbi:hypothetical protein EG68_06726 [Paragonimus skrjabini miyazakii]|uniref:Uncharacterized protein n=1 Tax=Paragonimus skrjabini miyazakii TaxID=59628 RepID=A0A8S9YMU5_9TREM|nr:hypothetical protein EG68_06726 [Paragonimus skrjabini miyazakii]
MPSMKPLAAMPSSTSSRLFRTTSFSFMCLVFLPLCFQITEAMNPVLRSFESLSDSVDRVLTYYKAHYQEMNFDGIFGLVLLRDSLQGLVRTRNTWNGAYIGRVLKPIEQDVTRKLSLVDSILPNAFKSLRSRKDPYFNKMGSLFKLSWTPDLFRLVYPFEMQSEFDVSSDEFDGKMSDQCLIELLQKNMSNERCQLSDRCIHVLSSRQMIGYESTHQVLLLLIIQKLGCSQLLAERMNVKETSLSSVETDLCSSIYAQFISLQKQGFPLTTAKKDLLLEQIVVCGQSGFLQFVNINFLEVILSWQDSCGCFLETKPETKSYLPSISRMLRSEMTLQDGCLSHLTAVASGALALYLQIFLQPTTSSVDRQYSFHEKLVAYYVTKNNPNIPELIDDQYSGRQVHGKASWTPSVSHSVVERLGKLHGFFIHIRSGPPDKIWSISHPHFTNSNIGLTYYLLFLSVVLCVIVFSMLCSYSVNPNLRKSLNYLPLSRK